MSRKDKREENKKHESRPKKKIIIKLPEFNGLSKSQITSAVVIVAILLMVLLITNYSDIGIVLNKHITDEDVTMIELIGSNNKIYPYYNEVLIASSSKLATYNKYGRKTWDLDMQGAIDSKIATCGKYLQVINTDKSIVYIYSDKYETAQIRIEGNIISGTINARGDSVIEYEGSGNKTTLAIYDKHGKAKYNVKLSNNVIGQYVLSDDSSRLAYVGVNINGISATAIVELIKLKEVENESQVEKIATEANTLIYELGFDGNNLIYRTDRDVVSINLNNKSKKVSNVEQTGVVALDMDDGRCSYVEFKNGKYLLGIKKIGGKETKEVDVKELPKHFIYLNDKVYVCFQKDMYIYNNNKMQIKEYKSDMVITKPVVLGKGNNIAFLVSNKLIIYTI